ncbi:hypothetical protein GQ44DRAFT_627636 [Phaeosphaeriaceae sp. PMI808]|nr:hypothetical protein GQ44DRAFT_627636 [Phaeosphaeriaceae sp. PMI808]
MFLVRTTGLLARSSPISQRFAAFGPRTCSQCIRSLSSSAHYGQSSKRQMQTATAYQPSSLYPQPPMPRNAGGEPEGSSPIPQQDRTGISIPEGEAQKSQAAPMKPLRPRRYNFGPRKATIKLSPSAVAHLRDLLNQPEPKLIRIGTKAKGCSGLAYHLEYVDKPSMLDEQVEQDGVKVLIDNKALLNIIGSEMDWLEDKLNERFIFRNPNITEQCGCGESFSVS